MVNATSEKIKKLLVKMAVEDDLPTDLNDLPSNVFDDIVEGMNKGKIVLDMEASFDNGEIDQSHAIYDIGRFLAKLSKDGTEDMEMEIENFVDQKNSCPEDIVNELQMELDVCDSIILIAQSIRESANKRIESNQKILKGLNELINRK